MKLVKKILLVILFLLVLIVIVGATYLQYSKPDYEGEFTLGNLNKETTVYFDDYGVPHIYAENQKDAMTTLGYVHAQDRLWQMELMRRIAPGRLSEIFGGAALKTDKFFGGIGIDENSAKAVAQLDKNSQTYLLAQAYLDGINQYIAEGKTPIEIRLLGIEQEKFTLKDVYNIFGFMSFSFAMAQKTDPLLTDIRDRFGLDYLKDFGINGELGTQQLQSFQGKYKEYSEISKSVTSLLEASPVPAFIGSNSWVIGGEKTKKGKVILANDPHIMYSQPGTWYEAHIVCPDYEMYGYYIAGTPFPLLGHNREYAYGLTMFENDDVDFFQEEENPNNPKQYKTPDGFKNYTYQQKTIKVKDSTDVKLNVKTSQHGPIITGLLDGLETEKSVAMHWIYTQQKNRILDAVYELSHAKNLESFHKSIELIHAPGLNIMYGDAKGNIAWITSGKLYKLPKSVNANFILNGANGIDDKKEWLSFDQNPQAINPPWHYVYSSNNQPTPIDGYLYPGYYLPKDRAMRINGLLEQKNKWDKETVSKMIVDNTSATAQTIVGNMTKALNIANFSANENQALTILKDWKATHELNDIAPTLCNKWFYFYLKATLEDEFGEENFKLLLNTHIVKQMIENQTANAASPWWDNVNTKDQKETQSEILTKSYKEAIKSLENQLGSDVSQWQWSKVHQVTFQHPIGKVKLFSQFFNVGPFPISGTNEVINNQLFIYTDEAVIPVKGGPSTRRIIDFSDIENSLSVLPTGQSGNPMSKHYSDQSEMFVNGKFRKMKLNKKEIEATSTKLIFKPKS
ncbi:penicillin acylase family protein [Flavobacterium sp. IMCC34852]|uniref:Penicillin acylase family protein n=1 Tax=Flavobacterium rivulicola TaxID=2732161 RepID=A0A7Y3R6U1_9FLAO|nr:penicillin acylase family protein [Flavobacterium sp. IMCC34852]NNT70611.1 penicillin acylase family protein [Flavobacterium sp. IMCC34852]